MKTIKSGFGYWDTTHYPRGGNFKRSDGTVAGEVTRTVAEYADGTPREVELSLTDGRTACVDCAGLL